MKEVDFSIIIATRNRSMFLTWVMVHGHGTQKMFLKRFAEKGIF